jgi:C4-type Zn-finger protein
LIVEDPSGNSFVQNPNAPNKDVYMVREEFVRSYDDYSTMGFSTE